MKPGDTFRHKSFIKQGKDPITGLWNKEKAMMRVTSVQKGKVYYTYDSDPENKGAFYLDEETFNERYGK